MPIRRRHSANQAGCGLAALWTSGLFASSSDDAAFNQALQVKPNRLGSQIMPKSAPKNPAAVALGTLGGKAKSRKKRKAAKENGKKGGRPKKVSAVKPA